MKKLLVIGHTFPEPTTTAAGTRMMQLIQLFTELGYQIDFCSAATASENAADLDSLDIPIKKILLNDPGFDEFITKLNPDIVIFDRFITEEQFGWRVGENCPNALKILDTEDLHFLRKAREAALKSGLDMNKADLWNDMAKRELASILRCDLSLIISEVEFELLANTFQIPHGLLYYLPFLLDGPAEEQCSKLPAFKERSHFVTIGNLQHAPNVDAVNRLRTFIWPRIRKQLPQAELHIYGAYGGPSLQQFHDPAGGFLLKGWAPKVGQVMKHARVCLAPLRFGAGLKGKLIDAMYWGTPSVTTSVGAEGITGSMKYPGFVADSEEEIVRHSVELYSENDLWERAQQSGFEILRKRFQKDGFSTHFHNGIMKIVSDIHAHRKVHFIGQVLQHQSLQAAKYMSKWIEAKNSR